MENMESKLLGKIENNFEVYLNRIEERKAKELIQGLKKGKDSLSEFTSFFLLRSYSNFTSEDHDTVINFLERKYELDVSERKVLHSVLNSRPSRNCESYYKKVIEANDAPNYQYEIRYLVDNDPPSNISFF